MNMNVLNIIIANHFSFLLTLLNIIWIINCTHTDIVDYYGKLGHVCPKNYNPSDFLMTLCQTAEEKDKESMYMTIPDELCPQCNDIHADFNADAVEFHSVRSFPQQVT